MNSIRFEDFANNIIILLKETFENPQGYYLDRSSGGLFGTLEHVSAATASGLFKPGVTTIAAHVYHSNFYLKEVVVRSLQGKEFPDKIDWAKSWDFKTVNDLEWHDLKQQLHETYKTMMQLVGSRETWEDQSITDTLVALAHTSYHVGAIRQMLLMLEVQSSR
jgi:hypothetical protein